MTNRRLSTGGNHASGDGQEVGIREPDLHHKILELRNDESDAILDVIFQKMNQAELQCRVRWELER